MKNLFVLLFFVAATGTTVTNQWNALVVTPDEFFEKNDTLMHFSIFNGQDTIDKYLASKSCIYENSRPGFCQLCISIFDSVECDSAGLEFPSYTDKVYGFHQLSYLVMQIPNETLLDRIQYTIRKKDLSLDPDLAKGWSWNVIADSIRILMDEVGDTILHHPQYYKSDGEQSRKIAQAGTNYKWRHPLDGYVLGPYIDTLPRINDITIMRPSTIKPHRSLVMLRSAWYDPLGRQVSWKRKNHFRMIFQRTQ